jgi:hypothetical protein
MQWKKMEEADGCKEFEESSAGERERNEGA